MRSDGLLQFVMVPNWIFGPRAKPASIGSAGISGGASRGGVSVSAAIDLHQPLVNDAEAFWWVTTD